MRNLSLADLPRHAGRARPAASGLVTPRSVAVRAPHFRAWRRTGAAVWLPLLCALFSPAAIHAAESTPPCESQQAVVLPADPDEAVHWGAKIPRTVALLATSTPGRRHPVKILVYGQSISGGLKDSCFESELRKRFPHAHLTYENRSIGGFSANQLARTAAIDIPLSYPDLVILHVYGQSAIDYERILADIRRRTTAEILVWTDHLGNAEDEGRRAREDEDSQIVRALAVKYDCELADVRRGWTAYLEANRLQPADLLSDAVHMNARGKALLTALLLRHFRSHAGASSRWFERVRTYEAKRLADGGFADEIVVTGAPWKFRANDALGTDPNSALKLKFTGNRIDVLRGDMRGLQPGTAKVLIDGRPPSNFPELYAFTLPSPAFGADYQPGIRYVSARAPLLQEDWTLRVVESGVDAFSFEIHGSRTGFDGRGRFELGKLKRSRFGVLDFSSAEGDLPDVFVSQSQRVVIDHRDLKVLWGQERAKQLSPPGWEIKWSVVPQFVDSFAPATAGETGRITLAQGLADGEHTLEIVPNGDGPVPIRAIEVHRPPLR
jgi:hypothetical protein